MRASRKQEISLVVTQTADYTPMRILEVEMGQPLPDLSTIDEKTGQYYRRGNCLVRLHTQPLGTVELELTETEVKAHVYVSKIWSTFSRQINEHLCQDGLQPITRLDETGISCPNTPLCIEERECFTAHLPSVSIIIATRDRPESLKTCLLSLLALHYPHYEIIVVDNAPGTNATANLIQQMYQDVSQIHYVREDCPGLSWARNCGMMTAKGEILAFTDDDMIVDPYWLLELVRGFSRANDVACVTGLILPMELETPAQFWFEEYGGYSKGYTRQIFDLMENHPKAPLYSYTSGRFGSGGSMAFTVAFLSSIGRFDCALGTGTPARGAEDIAAFFQVITKGYKLVYEPVAVAYHLYYRDYAGLRKQIYNYGIGLTVFLMNKLFDNPFLLFDLIAKAPYGLFFTLNRRSPKNNKKSVHYPKELTRFELQGMLYGPFAYMQSRRAVRKANSSVRARSTLPRAKEKACENIVSSMD